MPNFQSGTFESTKGKFSYCSILIMPTTYSDLWKYIRLNTNTTVTKLKSESVKNKQEQA